MASLAFQPFVDKENAGSFGVRPNKGQSGAGLGKIFGKGNDGSLVTPRKALGVVNRDLNAVSNGSSIKPLQKPQQSKGLQMKSTNIQPLSSRSGNIMQKPSINENIKKKTTVTTKVAVKTDPVPQKKVVDDIEKMHIPTEEEDDFEDIWPKSERISTYLHKLVKWRPPCLFGDLPESDDEEDEIERQKRIQEEDKRMEESLAKYASQNNEEEEIKVEDLLVPEDFDDVPLPSISLDISQDILENIGHLELKES